MLFRSSQRTGTVLQAANATNEIAVQTARYLSREHQKWNITPAGGGGYKISSATGENVLTADGDDLKAAPFTGADNQLWKIDQLTDGSYRLASKSNHAALAALVKTAPGNRVSLQHFTGDDAQRWVIAAP